MVLDPQVMIDSVKDLQADTEPVAASAWTDLIINYLKTATGIIPSGFTQTIIDSIKTILDGPTSDEIDPPLKDGMSADGVALTAIPAAFTAIWAAMIAAPPTFFATATAITPPPSLALIAVDLVAAIPINLMLNGSGIPPSTGTMEGDKELATTILVLGDAILLPGTGFHIRNQGGTWIPPSGPPVVIT